MVYSFTNMGYGFTECTMSTKAGFILYKNIEETWKISISDEQNSEEKALMYKSKRVDKLTRKIQFALCFKRDNVDYSPVVADGKLEMKPNPDISDDGYWFEKVQGDEYHTLQAVREPRVYLYVDENGISTCPDPAKGLLVRVKSLLHKTKKSESLV